MTELYKKYRPKDFDEMVGQPDAVKVLSKLVEKGNVPHALSIIGPSGTGKTTAARIIRKKIGCGSVDYREINAAESRGIDTVREIQGSMGLSPISGKSRCYCIDEAARLTSDAQSALLKTLEDTPSHVWFILCTTDPGKLLPTIRTRCTEIKMRSLTNDEIEDLVESVVKKEKAIISEGLPSKIADVADGSARKALVLLGSVIGLPEDDQNELIQKAEAKKQAIELARVLINRDGDWPKCAAILKGLEDDAEGVRQLVRHYAQSVLLGTNRGAWPRAALVLECFGQLAYNKTELTRAAYEVFVEK